MEPLHKVLVRSEQSEGRVALIENTVPTEGAGPPLHKHDFDEAFYVIEGELTFQVDDDFQHVGAGGLVFAPGGTPHTFANFGRAPARFLLVCTPAGWEREFARRVAKQTGAEPPEWALQPLPGFTTLGPPLRERN